MGSLLPLGQYGCALQVPVPGFHANPGFASLSAEDSRKWKAGQTELETLPLVSCIPISPVEAGPAWKSGGDLVMPLLGLSFRLCNIETGVLLPPSFPSSHHIQEGQTVPGRLTHGSLCKNCYGENRN